MNRDREEGFDNVNVAINGGIHIQDHNLGEVGSWGVQVFAVAP